eukprot:3712381-Amphidinium_carterae.3
MTQEAPPQLRKHFKQRVANTPPNKQTNHNFNVFKFHRRSWLQGQSLWSSDRIEHICTGCCRDRQESILKTYHALMGLVGHSFILPALNKWTTMYQSIQQIALLANFYDMFAVAESRMSQKEERIGEERAALAMPSATFLQKAETKVYCVQFLIIAEPLMSLHWKLFSNTITIYELPRETGPIATTQSQLAELLRDHAGAIGISVFCNTTPKT